MILKNGRIVSLYYDSSDLLDILIADGVIKEIGTNLDVQGQEVLDIIGHYVLPGLIDMHCNICDPGFEYIEDIESASLSAAKGGFTTITCQPNTKPAIDNKTVVEYITSKSKLLSPIHILPYGSMSIGCQGKELAEMGEMHQVGIVGISDGDETVEDAGLLRNIFKYSLMFHMPVITHCEDKTLSGKGVMHEGYISTMLGLKGMPREAEETIVARNIVLAENVGNPLHIAHVSSKGSVQLIREAKKRGVQVTCETCPHYFLLTDKAALEYNTLAKVNPPLRTQEDVDAMIEGLQDGTIDVIASGHSPAKFSEKHREFGVAAYGISALETAFALSYTALVSTGKMSLSALAEKMSYHPAQILGLNGKGRIAVGSDADLIVVNLDESYEIQGENFASKAKFSPFDGKTVWGKIEHTIVSGKRVII